MKSMDTLPTTNQTIPPPPVPPMGATPVGSMAKEAPPIVENAEAPLITEIGKEVELTPEVRKAGVTMKSETIVLPEPVQRMGVTPVGPSAPQPIPAVTLPLSDDQIAQGLHQSILSSWRWLAEWCERQLKQAHIILKSMQGKAVREKE